MQKGNSPSVPALIPPTTTPILDGKMLSRVVEPSPAPSTQNNPSPQVAKKKKKKGAFMPTTSSGRQINKPARYCD